IGLLDLLQITRPPAEVQAALAAQARAGAAIVLIDALYEEQLLAIGAALDGCAAAPEPLFSVGSSGVEMALGQLWAKNGTLTPAAEWPRPGRAAPLLVVSGSCSPVTTSSGAAEWPQPVSARPARLALRPAAGLFVEGRAARFSGRSGGPGAGAGRFRRRA
ncbi:MAG: hypothetical protein EOO59_08390, partial [Hymenobacter sp.]